MDSAYDCRYVVEIDQEPRHELVIENDYVRAFAVEIAPHDRTLCHHHAHDYLLYVASTAEIVSAARDEEPKRLSYQDGECELSSAGLVHVVENPGETPFRNIVVELLSGVDGLCRGARPKLLRGAGTLTCRFSNDRAAIFTAEMKPGAEIEILGPAVVATPYDDHLNPDEVAEITVERNGISDLAWIPPGRRAILWLCVKNLETAVVFQLGATDEELVAVPKTGEPQKVLRAHAEESE
jgi:hypothetical protein